MLERVRIKSPFLLRTVEPPITSIEGQAVRSLRRIGKRIAFGFERRLWLVLHLMIAGRLHWVSAGSALGGKSGLAALDFSNGTLTLTESGTKHRAALYLFQGDDAPQSIDPGGIDVFTATLAEFRAALIRENHTIKRALTDPHIIDGIGNAYSDEILWGAKLSPLLQTQRMSDEQWDRLHDATRRTLQLWIDRLKSEAQDRFPEKVTAFRPDMAVHGKFKNPCPRCGNPVARICYADNETNYCPTCQTNGRVLADRALSRLLK